MQLQSFYDFGVDIEVFSWVDVPDVDAWRNVVDADGGGRGVPCGGVGRGGLR